MIEVWSYGPVPCTLTLNLVCDLCGVSRMSDNGSFAAMRAAATAEGWRETFIADVRCFICPAH